MRSLHESDDQLELYALDRLPDDAVERVEEHLIVCDTCRIRLEDVGSFALTMKQALRTEPVLKPHRRVGWFEGWQLKLAFTGSIAFAVLLAFFAVRNGHEVNLPPVASIALTAVRGATPPVSRAKELDVILKSTAAGRTVEIADSTGKVVWSGTPEVQGADLHLRITKELGPGTYFVQVKSAGGGVPDEYGFQVR